MRRLAILFFPIALAAQIGKAPNPTVFGGLPEKTVKSDTRTIHGQILDLSDGPLEKSVVYLKNVRTLKITTFITGKDGTYHFTGLNLNVDYEIRAEHESAFSSTRTLSLLDGRKDVSLNIKIDPSKVDPSKIDSGKKAPEAKKPDDSKKPDDTKKPDEAPPDAKKKPGA